MTVIISITVMFFLFFDINANLLNKQKKETLVQSIGKMGLSQLSTSLSVDTTIRTTYNNYRCTFKKKPWGGYAMCHLLIENSSGDTVLAKAFLIGKSKGNNKVSLLLRRTNVLLHIGANVFLENECYIPEGTFRPYSNTRTEDYELPGKLYESQDTIPQMCNTETVAKQFGEIRAPSRPSRKIIAEPLSNSFWNVPYIVSSDTIFVTGKLDGHIILNARQVFISAKAEIKDALIFAESIHIEDKFTGSLQMFARDSIVIGKEVNLKYPTIVTLSPVRANKPGLVIDKSSRIAGDVYAHSNDISINRQMRVFIQDSCKIIGTVVTTGSLRFRGVCYGTVICDHTIDNVSGNTQENLLFNAKIFADSLPDYYAYANLFPLSRRSKIVSKLN